MSGDQAEWKVTTDDTSTNVGNFLKELRKSENTPDDGAEEDLSLVTSKNAIKLILLGDSAVGKTKLVERFLMDGYKPHQLSTFALTLFRHNFKQPDTGEVIPVDIWDTAGQERFQNLHPSYFYQAHACILVFDVTRKVTYKNLELWHQSLTEYCNNIPCFVVANKIDVDYKVTSKNFNFAAKRRLPFHFVSASDGTNVVKVFHDAMLAGKQWKDAPPEDYFSEVMSLLSDSTLGVSEAEKKGNKAQESKQAPTRPAVVEEDESPIMSDDDA
mmetsp:Transcript_19419/g.32639  ORF Transcript_19419/g.32639 Transcript_19419/m.32639 type:complete len:271 (+) Transcript_19419:374-1186(+)|eukprot:CAMPEP_0198214176 /NCGR_PEP_ID=MMETSP1445-20131203/38546_1 /TAXON_ID=36898 /ORGANISM="Pyramimonas sp., Strain CCMP2087" /LENGTH=270 /DNA_ID=CAMNT_0043889235 /DNA_START=335 /DNA_END=1147 /DNA_ORIENTATION=-